MSAPNAPLPERDELLRAAALGELDRRDPELARRLRAEPELARALEELERTRATTARVLEEGAALIASARAGATSADRALVEGTFRRLAGGDASRPGRRRGWLFVLVGVAAALLLGFFLWPHESVRAPDVRLGDDIHFALDPSTAGLSWTLGLGPGETLELSFYTDRDGTPGERLLGPLSVTDQWQPSESEARVLSGPCIVELVRHGDRDELLGRLPYSSRPYSSRH
jgi:hypothetical protein